MNSENETTQRHSGLSGESTLAIISVAMSAFWIAFAYYHGDSTDADGNRILLLHPLVPIALIILLIRIYRWVGIKFVVHLEIIMIGLWIFVRMLGVFMPFIIGFGFAYLFRFLWRALPFKEYYQRAIATVLIVFVCGSVLVITGIAVGNQLNQMAKGLQIYFHESMLPLVMGEEFVDIVYDESGEEKTLYLATDHGIYFYQIDKETATVDETKRSGITNGEIVGKRINAISVNDDYIYAGTNSGIFRLSKKTVEPVSEDKNDSSESTERIGFLRKVWRSVIRKRDDSTDTNELEWEKIKANIFETRPVQAINTPSWDSKLIYAGTNTKLYSSQDSGKTWIEEEINTSAQNSIKHITSIEKYEVKREDIPKSTARKDRPMYLASLGYIDQSTPKQDTDSNIGESSDTSDTEDKDTEEKAPTITTIVYERENPSDEWDPISNETNEADGLPTIKVLAAIDNQNEELYAGTVNGLFSYYGNSKNWKRRPDYTYLPKSVTVLTSSPSGIYAGDHQIIYFLNLNENDTWQRVIENKQGIIDYRDSEIVMQFQEYLTEKIPGWTASGGAFVRWLSELAGSIAFQFGGFIATLTLAFIVFVYASQGFDRYTRSFINLVPERHRETAMAYLREIDRNMHQFLKGQFTVIVIISILSCIVYHIIGVPFALLVGILAGLCNAIPTFGPFIGGGFAYIAMLMGLAAGEFTNPLAFFIRCVFVLGAILGIQTIDNSLISPKVMSNAVDVDPLLIMFAVIVGASILGFWGVLLAIPIIVVIKSIITVSKATANGTEPVPTQEQS